MIIFVTDLFLVFFPPRVERAFVLSSGGNNISAFVTKVHKQRLYTSICVLSVHETAKDKQREKTSPILRTRSFYFLKSFSDFLI